MSADNRPRFLPYRERNGLQNIVILFDLDFISLSHGAHIPDLNFEATQQSDLRGGRSPWFANHPPPRRRSLIKDIKCDTLIVGGGITGALMAEELTRKGQEIIIIDRELAGRGSTAASTAMLLWEIDRSLRELTGLYGFERAMRCYRASFDAVAGLKALVARLDLPCDMRAENSLYLAVGGDTRELAEEHALRQRAELPGTFLDQRSLLATFEIARAGAIVSPGAADADPMQLSSGLLAVALGRGAQLFEAEAVAFDAASRSVGVQTAEGRTIEARHVVLATGYVMPDIVHSTVQKPSSSWAIATTPQPDRLWKDSALIWEDSKDYLYARTTASGRIIIGGEDSDEIVDPDARDALIPQKAAALTKKLETLWPRAELDIEYRWSGTFDTTSDGLPLIGPVPGAKGIHAAYGYGGNGITFSYLAAQLISGLIGGSYSPLLQDFALDREGT